MKSRRHTTRGIKLNHPPSRRRGHAQPCPACGCKSTSQSVRQITRAIIERYHVCTNADCAQIFKTRTEVVETVVPPINHNDEAHDDNSHDSIEGQS